jgi:hypothetical protein
MARIVRRTKALEQRLREKFEETLDYERVFDPLSYAIKMEMATEAARAALDYLEKVGRP